MSAARFVDLSRTEVVITAKPYEPGDEDGFGICDARGFWWSSVYRSRESAERTLGIARSELADPVVVPVILQGQSRLRLYPDGMVILSPETYRAGLARDEFERRYMAEAQWEVRKATAHEWLPPEWRRNTIVPPQEKTDAA